MVERCLALIEKINAMRKSRRAVRIDGLLGWALTDFVDNAQSHKISKLGSGASSARLYKCRHCPNVRALETVADGAAAVSNTPSASGSTDAGT